MPILSYQSDALTPALAASCALRMVVGVNGVSLMVKKGEQILALKAWQFSGMEKGFEVAESELRQVFGGERLLEWTYASKKCALGSAATTLVPRRLFDPLHLEHYFRLLLQENAHREYGYTKLEAFDCYLVWAVESGLNTLCRMYFSTEEITHIGASLLPRCHELSPQGGYAVFAHLRGQKVQISVFERKNLVLFNAYDFSKPSDLLYYVLLVYQQFDLNPLEIPLTLSGTLMEDSEIFRLLLRYIRPMRFPPNLESMVLPETAQNLPPHYWFDLSTL